MDGEGFGATADDVRRLVHRDFGVEDRDLVFALLGTIAPSHPDSGAHRLRAAVVIAAAGDLDALADLVDATKVDERDVLVAAFYRESM